MLFFRLRQYKLSSRFAATTLLFFLFASGLTFEQVKSPTKIRVYAKKPLFSSKGVTNPYSALFEPDGRFSRIRLFGNLDLELTDWAENLEGPDIEVFTTRYRNEWIYGTMVFQIFAKLYAAEPWTFLGSGSAGGQNTFDFQNLSLVRFIRIVYANPYLFLYPPDARQDEFGVDAVVGYLRRK